MGSLYINLSPFVGLNFPIIGFYNQTTIVG